MRVRIFTDGACSENPGPGGWAAVFNSESKCRTISGNEELTTNNRMELRGVLMALEHFDSPETIEIYSDSSYVVNSINQKHVWRWFENQDYSKKNLDLWFKIIELLDFHNVVFHWVKGHNESELNNIADMYAVHASQCLNLPIDEITSI